MDCTAIFAEVSANNQRVQELAEEQGFKVAQNVVTGVAGFIVPVFGSGWTGKAPPLKKLQLSRVVNNILRR